MIDIEIFFVADRSAKVEALPNQIYIYIYVNIRGHRFDTGGVWQRTRSIPPPRCNFPLSFSNTSPSPPPLIERRERSTRGHVIGRPFGLIVPSTSQLTFIRPILTLGSDHRRIVCIAVLLYARFLLPVVSSSWIFLEIYLNRRTFAQLRP